MRISEELAKSMLDFVSVGGRIFIVTPLREQRHFMEALMPTFDEAPGISMKFQYDYDKVDHKSGGGITFLNSKARLRVLAAKSRVYIDRDNVPNLRREGDVHDSFARGVPVYDLVDGNIEV